MDKYEYKLKLDQMKSFMSDNNYQAAAQIADSINWHKIKNVNALMKVGEIYEKVGRYEESKDILLTAYDRSPIGRMIIYRLAKVAVKMGNYDEAKDYYQEFVEIAPHDNLKYVLKYEICKAEGADLLKLIGILEELKEQEYSEEWAFELACLYHKANMSDKCIEACDELILWFGDGPYVERALELKMLYQPLTRQQEEKYRQFRLKKEGIVEVRPEDMLESGEIINETVQIPDVKLSPERFNTQNLQEELQKSMQQIMEATEKEAVDDSMDNIKKLVEDIPYLQLPKEEQVPVDTKELPHIETDAEIDKSLKNNFQEMLAEDYDGQISLFVPERSVKEPQVSGQMSIEDVLQEWEKTKRAAEAALQEAEQRKLESAKARALQEAGDIMERLVDVIPKLDSGFTPKDLLEEQYLAGQPIAEDRAAAMVANMNQILQQEIDRLANENAQMDEMLAEAAEAVEASGEAAFGAAGMQELIPDPTAEFSGAGEELAESSLDLDEFGMSEAELLGAGAGLLGAEAELPELSLDLEEFGMSEAELLGTEAELLGAEAELSGIGEGLPEISLDMGELGVYEEGTPAEEEKLPEISLDLEEFGMSEAELLGTEAELLGAEAELSGAGEGLPEISLDMGELGVYEESTLAEEEKLPEISLDLEDLGIAASEVAKKTEELPKIAEPEEDAGYRPIKRLSKEQREIFTYFVPIKGMERQLCQAMTGAIRRLAAQGSASTGNMIIQGNSGSGKTVLATSMVKALQKEIGKPNGRVGKIEASVLNQRDVAALLKKVAGGCLIIEKAGEITKEAAIKLSQLLEADRSGILVIMEDTRKGIEKALSKDAGFASRFSEKINIPIFTSDELVAFAKSYANELGYTIDEMGVLALYNSISNIQKLDQATTLTEVKEIVDRAIERAERGGLKKAFSIITSRRYDADDYIILREKDFDL